MGEPPRCRNIVLGLVVGGEVAATLMLWEEEHATIVVGAEEGAAAQPLSL
jgi:hypothetical protein